MKKLAPLLVLLCGLGVLALVALAFAPNIESPLEAMGVASSGSATTSPRANVSPPPSSGVAPFDELGRAKARALAWHPDAVLVSMHAEPIDEAVAKIDEAGYVQFVFGVPVGNDFGSTPGVGPERLNVRVDAHGTSARKTRAVPSAAALEPRCSLEDALERYRASESTKTGMLEVDFMMSDRYGKAVWRIGALRKPSTLRTLDGVTCAILVR